MTKIEKFQGFYKETLDFFSKLKRNNNKSWFEANRHIYEKFVIKPAQTFVGDLGNRLEKISPNIVAIPKIDKSIFRIYRDIRFSADKTPYKTQLAMLFWEGPGKKLESPGFYLHFNNEKLFLGVGMHEFPKHFIQDYRDSVIHPQHGPELEKAIKKVQKNPDYRLGWKYYKKIPSGYNADHPNAEFLLYRGIGFQYETSVPDIIFSEFFVDYIYKKFEQMSPIYFWIREMVAEGLNK
jgi:uncharacterized protein (TIGR02453 family)